MSPQPHFTQLIAAASKFLLIGCHRWKIVPRLAVLIRQPTMAQAHRSVFPGKIAPDLQGNLGSRNGRFTSYNYGGVAWSRRTYQPWTAGWFAFQVSR